MKRLFAMILAVVMLLSIAACSGEPVQNPTDPTEVATDPTEIITEPTQAATTAPTQGETEPTQAQTEPAQPETDPTTGEIVPTQAPTAPTQGATAQPTIAPTQAATGPKQTTPATNVPTQAPTARPTTAPTAAATVKPTTAPTQAPTQQSAVTPTFHEHNFTVTVVPATCTLGGYTHYSCPCGRNYNDDMTPKKGHGVIRTETEAATYEENGVIREICTDCNTIIKETAIPRLEHTCNMVRINCRDLKDNAVGWYTATYRTYNEFTILACSLCGQADTNSMEFVYDSQRNSEKIVELINQERRRVYGTDEYDVVVATHHSAAEWGAEYISTDFQHITPFRENIYQGGMMGDLTTRMFEAWMESPPHYALMIDKDAKYVSLGMYLHPETGLYSMLIMFDKDELYLDNPNYTWHGRD